MCSRYSISCPLFHVSLASGVAAVSGGAVFVIIAALVLCVVVALVVKLRGTCKQRVEDFDVFEFNVNDVLYIEA